MVEKLERRRIWTRVISKRSRPFRNDWAGTSPEERVEAVWLLSKLCYAWNSNQFDEPRLQSLLLEFNAVGVEYLVVGAHAVYGYVRATKDLYSRSGFRPYESTCLRSLMA
jgi:hypothetical protein